MLCVPNDGFCMYGKDIDSMLKDVLKIQLEIGELLNFFIMEIQ